MEGDGIAGKKRGGLGPPRGGIPAIHVEAVIERGAIVDDEARFLEVVVAAGATVLGNFGRA